MALPAREQLAVFYKESRIVAGKLVPVGKETDRRWEQGEDPSMLDPETHLYETPRNLFAEAPGKSVSSTISRRSLIVRRLFFPIAGPEKVASVLWNRFQSIHHCGW
jgi:hypothetical protein